MRTITSVEELLNSLPRLQARMKMAQEEIARLGALAENIRCPKIEAKLQMTPKNNESLSNYINEKIKQENKLKQLEKEYFNNLGKINALIDALPDEYDQRLFRLKYVHGYDWKQLEEKMPFSVATLYRRHSNALGNMAKNGKNIEK